MERSKRTRLMEEDGDNRMRCDSIRVYLSLEDLLKDVSKYSKRR